MDARVTGNLDVALALAREGVYVFPCQSSGPTKKQPCKGVYWRSASTRDEAAIRAFWVRYPEAVPGIDLGKSGLIAIDCDRKLNDGIAWFLAYAGRHGDALDSCPQTDTPSGGRHHFWRNIIDHGNGRGQLPPKREADIDVRGNGGFVIAPGAVFADSSGAYTGHGSLADAQDMPQWLIDLLTPHTSPPIQPVAITVQPEPVSDVRLAAYGERALAELLSDLSSAPPGARNDEANRIAFRVGQLVGGNCLTRLSAIAHLESAAMSWGIRPNDKALGPRGTIARALDAGIRAPRGPDDSMPAVTITLGHDAIDPETGEILSAPVPAAVAPETDYPDVNLAYAPPLISDVAEWIMATSMFPSRLFATAAALAMVGTAIGRQIYTGVPRTGTALYWLIVAPTASGKDRPQEAIKQIFEAAGLSHLVKSSVSSSAKLGLSLQDRPLQIQVIDEVGKVLRKFVGRNASTQEMALLDDYCTVWGKNLGSFSPEGVTTRSDISIKRPSLTMFGATTPSNFYSQLRSSQIAGGFLNRFIVLQRFERVPENPHPVAEEAVPERFVEAVSVLHTFQDGAIQAQSAVASMPDHTPPMHVVPASPAAEAALTAYRANAFRMILRADDDPIFETWARAAEMVKRMAVVLACARHWRDIYRAEITEQDVAFSASLVDWAMDAFVTGMRNHMSENSAQANFKMVLGLVRSAGRIGRSELVRRVDGRLEGWILDAVIKALIEGGSIVEHAERAGTRGPTKRFYTYQG